MHHHAEHEAKGIHEQMAFAARELLRSVVAVRATRSVVLTDYQLAIENGGARRRLAPALLPHPLAQGRMDLFPGPDETPPPQVGVHRGPRDVLAQQHPPDIPDSRCVRRGRSVEDLPQIDRAWTSTRLGSQDRSLAAQLLSLARIIATKPGSIPTPGHIAVPTTPVFAGIQKKPPTAIIE